MYSLKKTLLCRGNIQIKHSSGNSNSPITVCLMPSAASRNPSQSAVGIGLNARVIAQVLLCYVRDTHTPNEDNVSSTPTTNCAELKTLLG